MVCPFYAHRYVYGPRFHEKIITTQTLQITEQIETILGLQKDVKGLHTDITKLEKNVKNLKKNRKMQTKLIRTQAVKIDDLTTEVTHVKGKLVCVEGKLDNMNTMLKQLVAQSALRTWTDQHVVWMYPSLLIKSPKSFMYYFVFNSHIKKIKVFVLSSYFKSRIQQDKQTTLREQKNNMEEESWFVCHAMPIFLLKILR